MVDNIGAVRIKAAHCRGILFKDIAQTSPEYFRAMLWKLKDLGGSKFHEALVGQLHAVEKQLLEGNRKPFLKLLAEMCRFFAERPKDPKGTKGS